MIDSIKFEQTDADEYALRVTLEDGEVALLLTTHEAVELYDAVHACLGSYIAERNAAKREYDSGIADDPAMQPVLDAIKSGRMTDPDYDELGMQLDAADLARKRAKGE